MLHRCRSRAVRELAAVVVIGAGEQVAAKDLVALADLDRAPASASPGFQVRGLRHRRTP
jgi:hypothetical protein